MTNCEFCSRKGTIEYFKNERTYLLCMECYEKNTLQDIYEKELIELDKLTTKQEYDRVLNLLDEIYQNNKHSDSKDWLKNSVWSHKALIYYLSRNYKEALDLYKYLKIAYSKNKQWYDFTSNQIALMKTMILLDNKIELIKEMESFVERMNNPSDASFLMIIDCLRDYYNDKNEKYPDRFLNIIRKISEYYGYIIPINEKKEPNSRLELLEKEIEAANERFYKLQLELQKQDLVIEKRIIALDKYIDTETLKPFRERAISIKDSLKEK